MACSVENRTLRFVEIHDLPWFPRYLRDGVTDGLQFILDLGRLYGSVLPILAQAIRETGAERVVDLCSGAGGPWLWLSERISELLPEIHLKIALTDLFPNEAAVARLSERGVEEITYVQESVDATAVPPNLKGFRTMFSSYHHFSPDRAAAILRDAVHEGEGIGIFEVVRRKWVTAAMTAVMPVAALATAPFMRPFRWSRIFWTYIVPVIPVVLFLDGVTSCLRAYRPNDLRELVAQTGSADYLWEVGEQGGGILPVTYLIGRPKPVSIAPNR